MLREFRLLLVASFVVVGCGAEQSTPNVARDAVVLDVAADGLVADSADDPNGDGGRQELPDQDDVGSSEIPGGTDNGAADLPDAGPTDVPGLVSCNTTDDCPEGKHCCIDMTGNGTCRPDSEQCGGGGFTNCETNEECGGGDMICCDFYGAMKMCAPASMCPGAPGGCETDADCTTPGQVCCKFGDLAETPTCMAEGMCPKDCLTDDDCPAHQECCDLNDTVVCLDKGECPQKCLHSTKECPLGQACCDTGDGLLICVNAAECPGSVPCLDAESTCVNSRGEPISDVCCEVPELGFRCVGSGGCGDWGSCLVDTDCPVGRECCQLEAGLTCVPTGACPQQGPDLPPCLAHADCTIDGDVCCIVPGIGTVCAPQDQCPSGCLSDTDCTSGICCIKPGSAAGCMSEVQCEMGKPCVGDEDCSAGNTCCDMGGNKTCMPEGQCFGSCTQDSDCDEGSKCCSLFGLPQKMCFPGACP